MVFLRQTCNIEKYQHYIDARVDVLPTYTETMTAVATSN